MSTDRGIDMEIVAHVNNGMLLSLKKNTPICIWVNLNKMDEPRADCTECSKSERERRILYINAYVWNLEKRYWWTYSSGDGENRLVDTVWEGERE